MEDNTSKEYFEKLYQRAEKWLEANGANHNSTLPASLSLLLQELSVHRVELEMQNEELRNLQVYYETNSDMHRQLLDQSPAGLLETDMQGRITTVNQSFCNYVNYNKSQIINLPFSFFIFSEDREKFYKFNNKIIKTSGKHSCEIKISGKNNIIRTMMIQGIFINESGNDKCIFSLLEIPEQKEEDIRRNSNEVLYGEESSLKKTQQELDAATKELDEFTSIISHDLQEPVRIVESLCRLLAHRYKEKLDPQGEELTQIIIDGAVRMRELVNELLNLTRVSANSKPFVIVDANHSLEQIKNSLASQIENSKAVIINDPLPSIYADRIQFELLLQNLISNAIKYHKKEENPVVHISCVEINGEWQFSVKDNGIGISPQFHKRIFRIFQRLHLPSEYEGTGVGLTLSKKIVERHRGRIWVESEEGMGSAFYFTIPKI